MPHRVALALSLTVTLALSAMAQSPSLYKPPDLSGTWLSHPLKLNLSRSVVQPDTKPAVLVIDSDVSHVEIRTTIDDQVSSQRFVIDGKRHEVPQFFAELNARSITARWEGSALVLHYENLYPSLTLSAQPPRTERWTLSANGKTLTMSIDGSKTLVFVYDKQ